MRYILLMFTMFLLVCLCVACVGDSTEHFKASSKGISNDPVIQYAVGNPVFVRRNGKSCFYKGRITKLPHSQHPIYTVLYLEGDNNPNGKTKCIEHIHQNAVYTSGGSKERDKKRVFRNLVSDIYNKQYVQHQKGWSYMNNMYCYPRKFTTQLQRWYPAKMRSTYNVRKEHYRRVSRIMNGIWQNTFVNIYVKNVNHAPSVISDAFSNAPTTYKGNDLYLDHNGCSLHAPQHDHRLQTQYQACNRRYTLRKPALLEMHLIGSDKDGSLLHLFQQILYGLDHTLTQSYGENNALRNFMNDFNKSLVRYKMYRERVNLNILKEHYDGVIHTKDTDSIAYNMYKIDQQIANTYSKQNDSPSQSLAHSKLYNRMFLLPIIRNPQYQTTAGNNDFYLCDHDAVISVGPTNKDITAEVSFAAKQNTTVTRLAFKVDTETKDMQSATLLSVRQSQTDTYYLSVWLHVFCKQILEKVIAGVSLTSSTDNAKVMPNNGLAYMAKKRIMRAVIEMFSLFSTQSVSTLSEDAIFKRWEASNDNTHEDYFTPLYNMYFENNSLTVSRAQWQMKHIIGNSRLNSKIVNVDVPWNNAVFGASVALDYVTHLKYDVQSYITPHNQSNNRFVVQKRSHLPNESTGWSDMLQIYISKRIATMRVSPQKYMHRVLIGDKNFNQTPYQHLNSNIIFGLYPDNVTNTTDHIYRNTLKYKSDINDKCYLIRCEQEQEDQLQPCCAGVDDVSKCSPLVTKQVHCTEPVREESLKNTQGNCHSNTFDKKQCEYAFTEMIHNCRNGVLIIEAENKTRGLESFWNYISDEKEFGVRLRLLNKMVKTLVLQVYEFNSDMFCSIPYGDKVQQQKLHTMERALSFLYNYYLIVGLYAPTASSISGNFNPEYIRKYTTQVKDAVTSDEEEIVFQTYDCVNITFRRLKENSEKFYFHDTFQTMKRLSFIRYSNYTDPLKQRDMLAPSVHPAMIATILGMDWYNANYVYKAKDAPIPSEEKAKEENERLEENAKTYTEKAQDTIDDTKKQMKKVQNKLNKLFESKQADTPDPGIHNWLYEMRVVRRNN